MVQTHNRVRAILTTCAFALAALIPASSVGASPARTGAAGAPRTVGSPQVVSLAGPGGGKRFTAGEVQVASGPADGRFLAVWVARSGKPRALGPSQILAQVLSSGGRPTGAPFAVSPVGLTSGPDKDKVRYWRPSVAWNSTASKWMVGWVRDTFVGYRHADSNIGIRAVSAEGIPGEENDAVGDAPVDSNDPPQIACATTSDNCLVVWATRAQNSLVGRLIDGMTATPAPVSTLATARAGAQASSALAWNPPSGRWILACTGCAGGNRGLYQTAIGSDGAATGSLTPVSIAPKGNGIGRPRIAVDPVSGQYVVAWNGGPTFGALNVAYVQRFSPAGARLGTDARRRPWARNAGISGVAFNATTRNWIVVWVAKATSNRPVLAARTINTVGALSQSGILVPASNQSDAFAWPRVESSVRGSGWLLAWDRGFNDARAVVQRVR